MNEKVTYSAMLKRGLFSENPTFVQFLALCPLLAVTTSSINGFSMGVATTIVMTCSSTAISLLRKVIPGEIRIAFMVILIATFVTIVQLMMEAFAPPAINDSLGIFIPLIVVNCILFARAESFALKNKFTDSAFDAFTMGLGYTLGLVIIGTIREVLGTGSIFGYEFFSDTTSHMLIMIMAPGAFFTLGGIVMFRKYMMIKKRGAN